MKLIKILKYFSLSLIFILLIIVTIFWLIEREAKNSLRIKNISGQQVVVVKATVNGKVVSDKKLLISTNNDEKKYSYIPQYAEFKTNHLKLLEVTVKKENDALSQATCSEKNATPNGCLFTAIYDGSNNLNCTCDSYSDFPN